MFQEFYTDTYVSRFIKNLLKNAPIPLYPEISDSDKIYAGCKYIYGKFIIYCLTTGRFKIDDEDSLYPSSNVYPSSALLPGIFIDGKLTSPEEAALGTYKVLDYYDPDNKDIHYRYHSKETHYDPETHYHLGKYLRHLKYQTGLDLMPFYNCYSGISIPYLTTELEGTEYRASISRDETSYKHVAIPVKFDRTYTIALESEAPVLLGTVIYNKNVGIIAPLSKADTFSSYSFLPSASFSKPFLEHIPRATTNSIYEQERNLYLIIRLPKTHDTGIVVLEGDYTDSWTRKVVSAETNNKLSDIQHKDMLFYLSLLHMLSARSFAFSDRLVEYLLLNVIHKDEQLDGNIKYAQDLVYTNREKEIPGLYGVWNDNIKIDINSICRNASNKVLLRDMDGYLNKDVEKLLISIGSDVARR